MLLDDSIIEFECNDSSRASPTPLPVNWDLDLSKIWIPTSVLPNRKREINQNETKPFILHTLEKPDYSKAFSVYSNECLQYHESPTSFSLPSDISHHKLINYDDEHDLQPSPALSLNAFKSYGNLDSSSENVISPKHPLQNKSGDSLRDCIQSNNSMTENATQLEKKAIDTYSVQEASCRISKEAMTQRMAEILSQDDCLHEDVIQTHQVTNGSTLDSIPPSSKDSLEDIYYSDEDEDHFGVEYELGNEIESPEKKSRCSIYTENSYVQEQSSESLANGLEEAKSNGDRTVLQSFEKTEEPTCSIYADNSCIQEQTPETYVSILEQGKNDNDKINFQFFVETKKYNFKNQNEVAADNLFSQNEPCTLNEIEFVDHANDADQDFIDCEGKSDDLTEKVAEFPIAYKRPPLQEQASKMKPQKGKKKMKKVKTTLPLEDLFQKEEVDRFKVPEVDEFFENLVRQGKCRPRNQEVSDIEIPSLNLKEKLQTNVNELPSINPLDQLPHSIWDSAQKLRENQNNEFRSNSVVEVTKNEEKAEPELESKDSFDTLVIENIPLNISKESIESVISTYGQLKNLTIERLGKSQRAKLQMDFGCDVEWIIESLDGEQPFGGSDKELIKCYRQT